jgi:hypothetical protein
VLAGSSLERLTRSHASLDLKRERRGLLKVFARVVPFSRLRDRRWSDLPARTLALISNGRGGGC